MGRDEKQGKVRGKKIWNVTYIVSHVSIHQPFFSIILFLKIDLNLEKTLSFVPHHQLLGIIDFFFFFYVFFSSDNIYWDKFILYRIMENDKKKKWKMGYQMKGRRNRKNK